MSIEAYGKPGIGVSPLTQPIWDFLGILEIAPLRRLSHSHLRFIEKELTTRYMVLGCSAQWRAFYGSAKWCRAWWKRSLSQVRSLAISFGHTEGEREPELEDIFRKLFAHPPQSLERLWIDQNEDMVLTKTIVVEFPSLKNLYWRTTSPPNITLFTPELEHAVYGAGYVRTLTVGAANRDASWTILCDPTVGLGREELDSVVDYSFENSLDSRPEIEEIKKISLKFAIPCRRAAICPCELEKMYQQLLALRDGLQPFGPIELYGSLACMPLPQNSYPREHRRHLAGTFHIPYWDSAQFKAWEPKIREVRALFMPVVPACVRAAVAHTLGGNGITSESEMYKRLYHTQDFTNIPPGLNLAPLILAQAPEKGDSARGATTINTCSPEEYLCINNAIMPRLRCAMAPAYVRNACDWRELWASNIERPIRTFVKCGGAAKLNKIAQEVIQEHKDDILCFGDLGSRFVDGVKLPNLEEYFADSGNSRIAGQGLDFDVFGSSNKLKFVEMDFNTWREVLRRYLRWADFPDKTYYQVKEAQEDAFEASSSPVAVNHFEEYVPAARYPWHVSDTSDDSVLRIMTVRRGARNLAWQLSRFRIPVVMGCQFMVVEAIFRNVREIYRYYEYFWTLRQQYKHKLRIVPLSTLCWHYPWDKAIEEMVLGEPNSQTWEDVRVAIGALKLNPDYALTPNLIYNPFTRHYVTILNDSRQPGEPIGRLTPARLQTFVKWYSRLRASLPPQLKTHLAGTYQVGQLDISHQWFHRNLQERGLAWLNQWAPVSALPLVECEPYAAEKLAPPPPLPVANGHWYANVNTMCKTHSWENLYTDRSSDHSSQLTSRDDWVDCSTDSLAENNKTALTVPARIY